MFSLARLAAPAKRAFSTRAFVAARPQISSAVVSSPFAAQWQAQRAYSAAAGLSADSIKERIMEVLTSFEKVDPSKVRFFDLGSDWEVSRVADGVGCAQVSVTSSFTNDLGLDSLDAVEVVMAIEGELRGSVYRPSLSPLTPCLGSAEEFSIEIPDEEADRITTVAEGEQVERWSDGQELTFLSVLSPAIDYISKSAEAH